MKEKTVAVILLNWNGDKDTIACLNSLLELDHRAFSVFVCDNASTNGSVGRIRQWAVESGLDEADPQAARSKSGFTFRYQSTPMPAALGATELGDPLHRVTLIETGENRGFSAGNNVGIRQAMAEGFDYYWILNNDTEVEPDALTWLLRRMEEDPSIGICGSTVVYESQRDMVQNWAGSSFSRLKGRGTMLGARKLLSEPIDQAAVEKSLGYVCGASMFVSRDFLMKVGLLAEDYFLYFEEIDWAVRAAGRFRLGYAAKSIVYHKVGASIGSNDFGDRSPLSDYYLARSRMKFCCRYSKISVPFALADTLRSAARWLGRGRLDRALLLVRAATGLPYPKS